MGRFLLAIIRGCYLNQFVYYREHGPRLWSVYTNQKQGTKNMTKEVYTSKWGETFYKVSLKSLKKGDEFKKKPDAKYCFYKGDYNRANQFDKTATYTCLHENDVWGGGQFINAKAYVYIETENPANYKRELF